MENLAFSRRLSSVCVSFSCSSVTCSSATADWRSSPEVAAQLFRFNSLMTKHIFCSYWARTDVTSFSCSFFDSTKAPSASFKRKICSIFRFWRATHHSRRTSTDLELFLKLLNLLRQVVVDFLLFEMRNATLFHLRNASTPDNKLHKHYYWHRTRSSK